MEGDHQHSTRIRPRCNFYPRPPGGGRLADGHLCPFRLFNFYPRPPGGGRRYLPMRVLQGLLYFYPRPPGGGRPIAENSTELSDTFLSTPSGWRATFTRWGKTTCRFRFLSTPSGWRATSASTAFNPSAPLFLSTPSGWRATVYTARDKPIRRISIHALRVEGDVGVPPVHARGVISIHALRVEGDSLKMQAGTVFTDFYPRPPGGGRRDTVTPVTVGVFDFYPRPPGGGRQVFVRTCKGVTIISIHALRVEGDILLFLNARLHKDFYPRPPGGGRPSFQVPRASY